ncbi:MAG TPA: hypothetical protein VFK57_14140 [Vicinamibacterales bacterium]|nr:hypothetical protein [Vicinamibacterales bacterium]
MSIAHHLRAAVAILILGAAAPQVEAQRTPALPDVLGAAGGYLAEYAVSLWVIAAEENYVQYDVSSGEVRAPRRFSADVVLVGLADGIEDFRDVFAIDGTPLVPARRQARGALYDRDPSAVEQARTLARDSIQRYLSPNLHGLDQPTLALAFLAKEHQRRSTFTIESVRTADGARRRPQVHRAGDAPSRAVR